MQQALRPYATAGVAIVGASLIAVTPAAVTTLDVHVGRDIALTSALGDSLAPWIEQYNTAAVNASLLANNFYLAPNVAMQQLATNLAGYQQQLLDDPTSLPAITGEMRDHYKDVISGLTLTNADADVASAVTKFTIAGDHSLLWTFLPGFLPADQADLLTPIVNFLGSPMSAIMMGAIGPGISPWIALLNGMTEGDGINEILANMTGAYFNGATLDLSALLPAINGAGLLPEGMSIDHLDLAFGGLLTGGVVQAAAWKTFDETGAVSNTIPALGGSMFNSLGIHISGVPLLGAIDSPSHAIGPLGAWQSLSELIGLQLGSDWNVPGTGKNPPTFPAAPPGTGFEFPTVPLPDDDTTGGANFTDVDLWSELSNAITNFQWSDVF